MEEVGTLPSLLRWLWRGGYIRSKEKIKGRGLRVSASSSMAPNQIFIRLLDGRTQCLQIPFPTISGGTLKRHLFLRTGIPHAAQRLISGLHEVGDETVISASEGGAFPSCTLLLRLRGGKGGFGSLLRGAATKAGQKKTNNFDACRDMSGRRLRHVNAEKRLEEWKAEAEDRRLEKVAEQFLKKKTKEVKKGSSVKLERYIEKYKEDSARCMEKMDESVRQSFALYEKSKRKILPSSGPASKRLKIWLGKKKMNESESDNEDDSDDDAGESVVLDDGNQNEGDGGLGSTSGSQSDPESSSGGSGQSNLEEENDIADGRCPNVVDDSRNEIASPDFDGSADPMKERCEEVACVDGDAPSFEARKESKEVCPEIRNAKDNLETNGQNDMEDKFLPHPSESLNVVEVKLTMDGVTRDGAVTYKDSVQSSEDPIMEEPFNFEEFNSSEEMEKLGMERLKKELQARGLKCGGTLQERAARLFLLKTTPIDKLPKKLLAKPLPAGK